MQPTGQISADKKTAQQYGKWMRLAMWYQRTPVLREINPFTFPAIVLMMLLRIVIPRGHCTCGDQFPDQHLSTIASEGNKEVKAYLSITENPLLCEARRQELLKKLKLKKKRQW